MTARTDDRLVDTVYERLRDEILAGELAPGSRLSVPALAERLAVSRSPVRDAVLRLTQERLAREEPRRGAVVVEVSLAELAALYEMREVSEGLAARLAVENSGRRFVDQLDAAVATHKQVVDNQDIAGHYAADAHFHRLIRQASGNDEVIRVLEGIQGRVRLAMRTTRLAGGPEQAVREHNAILAAIKTGDPARAEAAARGHIARLKRDLHDIAHRAVEVPS